MDASADKSFYLKRGREIQNVNPRRGPKTWKKVRRSADGHKQGKTKHQNEKQSQITMKQEQMLGIQKTPVILRKV